jgi:hypothetical protein
MFVSTHTEMFSPDTFCALHSTGEGSALVVALDSLVMSMALILGTVLLVIKKNGALIGANVDCFN